MKKTLAAIVLVVALVLLLIMTREHKTAVVSVLTQSKPKTQGTGEKGSGALAHGVATQSAPAVIALKSTGAAPIGAKPAVSANGITDVRFVTEWQGKTLSREVSLALGASDQAVSQGRLDVIHRLRPDLALHEVDALCEFLKSREEYGVDLSGVKNDILSSLIEQEPVPPRLQAEMLGILNDKTYPEWWRDYVVQHLELLCRRQWRRPGEDGISDQARQEIVRAYFDAADEAKSSVGGTALLGLERLSRDYPEFSREKIKERAISMAGDTAADLRCRIAAMQVAGLVEAQAILSLARDHAASATCMPLRISSIATISKVGGVDDVSRLRAMAGDANTYVQKAAASALQVLESRLASRQPSS